MEVTYGPGRRTHGAVQRELGRICPMGYIPSQGPSRSGGFYPAWRRACLEGLASATQDAEDQSVSTRPSASPTNFRGHSGVEISSTPACRSAVAALSDDGHKTRRVASSTTITSSARAHVSACRPSCSRRPSGRQNARGLESSHHFGNSEPQIEHVEITTGESFSEWERPSRDGVGTGLFAGVADVGVKTSHPSGAVRRPLRGRVVVDPCDPSNPRPPIRPVSSSWPNPSWQSICGGSCERWAPLPALRTTRAVLDPK
jgi:hypothetical protein